VSGQVGNLDELGVQLTELRELIRDGHGLLKDLRAAIRDARALADDAAREAERAARQAAISEMRRFETHVQAEMDRSAADLNRALRAARDHLVKALTPKIAALEVNDDDAITRVAVTFEANLFDSGGVT
jgi:F0F1-type ATP synthase membrane subunit b/b'